MHSEDDRLIIDERETASLGGRGERQCKVP